MPIVLKGIQCKGDAIKAAEMGCHVWVSNHGGRQLDTCLSSVEMLADIAPVLKNYKDIEIYVDGGIRRGSDIFKLLALGARAVFLGRPVLFSNACEG